VNPNPVLRRLGFDDNDRVVIIHADDVGMCQATVPAFANLVDFGLVSSGTTMVPCPWFPHLADHCRRQPAFDMGVHLTLTSEWDSYRWGPVSTRDPISGLIDKDGYFHCRVEEVQEHGVSQAVQVELEMQLSGALAAGVDATHIDTHMYALVHPKFLSIYTRLAQEYRLPLMILRLDEAGWRALGFEAEAAALTAHQMADLEAQGFPLLDNLIGLPFKEHGNRLKIAKDAIDSLLPGLTHLIIHPAQDTPELRAATPTTWRYRVDDYHAFMSEELQYHIARSGVQVIGYRALRALLQ
jgi:predicted glycoside hydrolase/deacetylase ChbG (UPF0249 family)